MLKTTSKMHSLLASDFFFSLKTDRILIVLILLGLIVRVGLMPFSMHVDASFTGDIATFPFVVQMWNSPEGGTGRLIYPPLFYHTISLYLLHLVSPFTNELWDKPISGLEARFDWIASPFVFRNLFVLKAWYLLPDLGIAYLLWRIFHRRPTQARMALLVWVFTPLVLYDAYIHGQFDLVPVFFVVLSLWLAWKEQFLGAALCIGIGGCFKNFPFIFLLPLVLIFAIGWRARLKMLLVGMLPYILLFIPSMENYASMGNYFSEHFLVAGFDLGFGASVYFFLVFYAALLWYLHQHRAKTFEDLWRVCFAILLVYYQFSYFDLHYWVWIVPFALIYWVEHSAEARPFYIVIGLCLLVLLTPTPLARFLAPISPRFFLRLPSLMEALNPYLPMLFIINVVRSLLAGTCFYLAWRVLRDMPAARSEAVPPPPGPEISA